MLLPLSDGTSKAKMRADMTVPRVDQDLAGQHGAAGLRLVGKVLLLERRYGNGYRERWAT